MVKPLSNKLGIKLLLFSLISVLIPILIFSFVATDSLNGVLIDNSNAELSNKMDSLEQILNVQMNALSSPGKYLANDQYFIYNVKNANNDQLQSTINSLMNSTSADFVAIVDLDKNIMCASANTLEIQKYLNSQQYFEQSFDILPNNVSKTIGDEYYITDSKGSLCMVVQNEIYDGTNHIGTLILINILTNDSEFIEILSNTVCSDISFTVDTKRVITSLNNGGQTYVGSDISNNIFEQINSENKQIIHYDNIILSNIPYHRAYKAIYDHNDEVIGLILIESSQENVLLINSNIKNRLFVGAMICIFIALIITLYTNNKITKPIEELIKATTQYKNGNYDYKFGINSYDELNELSSTLQLMAKEIKNVQLKLKSHADKLQETCDELQKVDGIKSDLIAIVSHEIRTPLTSIKGYVELIIDETLGSLNQNQKNSLNVVHDNIDRLNRMIESMLDLSKIERGSFELNLENVNIKNLLYQINASLNPQLSKKQISVSLSLDEGIIFGDVDRLTQVFTNLIENAIKFSSEKSTIEIVGEQNYIGGYKISITDHGQGIPEKELHKIFDRFYQVDSSTKRSKNGSGLGLAVCKNIIEAHDGVIYAESNLGKGSTFIIQLPLKS